MTSADSVGVQPLVTAVIPVYNGAAFVGDAIESVLAQTYTPLECIVVDDGSADETPDVVARFGQGVRYLRKANGGVASARNRGVEAATGELVAFLDADDTWAPDKIEKQIAIFNQNPGLGLVYCGISLVDERMQPIGQIEPAPPHLALRNTLLLEKPFVTGVGSTALVPVPVFHQVAGFDERLSTSADCDLTCRIAIRHPVACSHELLARYRRHTSQMSARLELLEHDMLLIYEKLFADGSLPPDVAALRRRAYANLYFTLAASSRHTSRRERAAPYFLRAFAHHPGRVAVLASSAVTARVRRLGGARDRVR